MELLQEQETIKPYAGLRSRADKRCHPTGTAHNRALTFCLLLALRATKIISVAL